MDKISKTEYEEYFRFHEFKRNDGNGAFIDNEIIATDPAPTITVTEKNSTVAIEGMIDNVSIVDGIATDTRVKYLLKGGTAGKTYNLYIQVTSSLGQKFEDVIELAVVASAPE